MLLFTEPLQASPAAHGATPVPWQHGCPMAPHARQASITQRLPAWQAAPSLQHGWPTPPQVAQLPGRPMSSLRPPQPSPAWQSPSSPVPQQVWPMPPHAPHLRPVALMVHDVPAAQAMAAPIAPVVQQA
jgi:hypothetical protein